MPVVEESWLWLSLAQEYEAESSLEHQFPSYRCIPSLWVRYPLLPLLVQDKVLMVLQQLEVAV